MFNKLVWEEVKKRGKTFFVLDSQHLYGILLDRVEQIWEVARRLDPEECDDYEPILALLVKLGATTQCIAEALLLIPEQMEEEEIQIESKEQLRKLQEFVDEVRTTCKETRSLQLGTKRFTYEFDEGKLEQLL
jgi:hypothetical protein